MGLFTMRERAMLANATFEIVSTHRGTTVRVRLPLAPSTTGAPPRLATLQRETRHAG
jgi:signal transduction histidine kinase